MHQVQYGIEWGVSVWLTFAADTSRKASRCVLIVSLQVYILIANVFYVDKDSSKDGLSCINLNHEKTPQH